MSTFESNMYSTQNDLIMKQLLRFYSNSNNIETMLGIINGESKTSLRIVDWFATNYSKQKYTVYDIVDKDGSKRRFKVYNDYKLRLKAYQKRRFDPFCRWDRITIPYMNNQRIQTTIGQLNFFKWALENGVVDYIEKNYADIESDMNNRNSTTKRNNEPNQEKTKDVCDPATLATNKTRKKREELSVSASRGIKKEEMHIVVKFN